MTRGSDWRVLLPMENPLTSQDLNRPVDPSRMFVEVVTMSGRAATVGFRVRMDTVEVVYQERVMAVYDREELRLWLRAPIADLVVDDVALTFDRIVDEQGRIAVTLPDVRAWTLSPVEEANLRDRVIGR